MKKCLVIGTRNSKYIEMIKRCGYEIVIADNKKQMAGMTATYAILDECCSINNPRPNLNN